MGISIVKTGRRDSQTGFFDIASSRAFNGYWLIGANELDLKLIPMFPCLFLEQDDVVALLTELNALQHWAKSKSRESEDEQYTSMTTRITGLKEFVSKIDWEQEEVSIG